MEKKKYKAHFYNKETNKYFGFYNKGKEIWFTPEYEEKRKLDRIEYYKKDSYKNTLQKWYNKNKEKIAQESKNKYIENCKNAGLKIVYNNIQNTSYKRKYEFNITIDYLYELWDKQDGKCYYTLVEMINSAGNRIPNQVSVDRIDSSKGYVKDNIALCCQSINYAKSNYNEEIFRDFLNKVKSIN